MPNAKNSSRKQSVKGPPSAALLLCVVSVTDDSYKHNHGKPQRALCRIKLYEGDRKGAGATEEAKMIDSKTSAPSDQAQKSAKTDTVKRAAYSPAEVCKLLGIARSTLYLAFKNESIASVRLGSRRLIPASELDRLLKDSA